MPKLTLAFIIVIIDQFSKLMVKYSDLTPIPENIVGDILRFTYIENPGLAFGISVGNLSWLLFIVTMLITLYIVYYLVFGSNLLRGEAISLNFILGGAIGNLIDRGLTLFNLYGYKGVVDFIDIGIGSYRWYIFNIADLSVSIGISIFVFCSYFCSYVCSDLY